MSSSNAEPFRVFFGEHECYPAPADVLEVREGSSELPEGALWVQVALGSEGDRRLQSKLGTIEHARIKQERPPIDFDGHVLIFERSSSEVMNAAFYDLVPVTIPPRGPVIFGKLAAELSLRGETMRLEKEVAPGPSRSWLRSTCRECSYPVVVTQGLKADYRWYCSRPECPRHAPEELYDTEWPSWVVED